MTLDPAMLAVTDQAAAEFSERALTAGVALDKDTVAFVMRDLLLFLSCIADECTTPEHWQSAIEWYAIFSGTALGDAPLVELLTRSAE